MSALSNTRVRICRLLRMWLKMRLQSLEASRSRTCRNQPCERSSMPRVWPVNMNGMNRLGKLSKWKIHGVEAACNGVVCRNSASQADDWLSMATWSGRLSQSRKLISSSSGTWCAWRVMRASTRVCVSRGTVAATGVIASGSTAPLPSRKDSTSGWAPFSGW